VLGALCCNGVIQHCDGNTLSSSISSAKPVTGNVMATLNGGGGRGDAPFSRGSLVIEAKFLLADQLSQILLKPHLITICRATVPTFLGDFF
jgi:hypothetical protein